MRNSAAQGNKWRRFATRCGWLLLVLPLVNCGTSRNYAPVVEAGSVQQDGREYHVVSRGETLYSIAWRYGMDFKGLARANNIGSPYTIFPGQQLLLKEQQAVTSGVTARSAQAPPPANRKRTAGPSPAARTSAPADRETAAANAPTGPVRDPWQWPAAGGVARGFSSAGSVHKGIDIHGKLGEPVRAANSGKVVYAGNGLVGYGNLVIVKHSDEYLSAYAHNRRLLVREGDTVKAGQTIAEMGESGTNRVKLHFEIRRDGKPVDPIRILPRSR